MKGKNKTDKKSIPEIKTNQFGKLISGVIMGYAITCIVFIGYALLLTYTDMTDKNLQIVVIVTTILSVMVAGFDAAKGANSKGWLWGIIAGLVYGLILMLIASIVSSKFASVTTLILTIAGGGLGGVLGINLRKK